MLDLVPRQTFAGPPPAPPPPSLSLSSFPSPFTRSNLPFPGQTTRHDKGESEREGRSKCCKLSFSSNIQVPSTRSFRFAQAQQNCYALSFVSHDMTNVRMVATIVQVISVKLSFSFNHCFLPVGPPKKTGLKEKLSNLNLNLK